MSANTPAPASWDEKAFFLIKDSTSIFDGRPVQAIVLLDPATNLPYAATGGTITGNSAAGTTAAGVPSAADYVGLNIGNNLVGQTGLALGVTTKAAQVAIVDATGVQITTFGGGTQYAQSSTPVTPTGTLALGRQAGGAVLALALDSGGNLNVNVASDVNANSFANTMPGKGIALGASDGTNLQALLVESSSNPNLRIGIYSGATEVAVTGANALKVDGSAVTQPVSGTFWQTTQPVSGTFWQATQPISGTVNLGTLGGAATAAKQPALGVAGTASTDVLTVQGIASMTPFKVDGSGVTQPVSGTFWQTTQPVSGTFWQATQPVSGTFWQATQPVSGSVTANIGTAGTLALDASLTTIDTDLKSNITLHAGTNIVGKVGIDQTTSGTTNFVIPGALIASGAADLGNPIKVGGKYNASKPTLADGQRGDLQLMSDGALYVYPRAMTLTDQISVWPVGGAVFVTNSWTYDGFGNQVASFTPNGSTSAAMMVCGINTKTIASAAIGTVIAAGTTTSADFDSSHFTRVAIDLKVTTVTGSGTINITINRKGADGVYYPLYTTGTVTTALPTFVSANIGTGMPTAITSATASAYGSYAVDISNALQVVVLVTGTSVTCSYSIIAKM